MPERAWGAAEGALEDRREIAGVAESDGARYGGDRLVAVGEQQLPGTRFQNGIQVPVSAIVKNNNKIGMLSGLDSGLDSSGRDVDIPVTTLVDLILIQPITVNPEIYNTNY